MLPANLVIGAVGLLLLAVGAWWWLTPGMAWWPPVAVALPWVLALPGLLRRRRKAYQAATLLASCYIGLTVLETVANTDARGAAALASIACGGVFIASLGALRALRAEA